MRIFTMLTAFILLTTTIAGATTPPLISSAKPATEPVTVTLEPLWSRGGDDDEEVLFGSPRDVVADAHGNVLVLDRQLNHIVAFDPDGELLGILGREGEGPGEFQRAGGLVVLPDGSVAGASSIGGRFERLAMDGTPLGSLQLGDDGPREGIFVLYRAGCAGGTLMAATASSSFDQSTGKMHRVQNLDVYAADGSPRGRLCEATVELDFTGTRTIEEVSLLRHFLVVSAVGPDGLVYVPHSRDEYVIDVFDAEGNLLRQLERAGYEAPERSDRDNQRMASLVDTWSAGAGFDIPFERCASEMTIQAIYPDERGHLFIRHAASNRDLPDGVFLRLDEFDAQGQWQHEVLVHGVGDSSLDTMVWLGGGRVAVQRGGALIALERWSDTPVYWDDEAEVEPELVVCRWEE